MIIGPGAGSPDSNSTTPSEDGEEEAAAAAIVVGWAMARQGVKFADAPALVAKARPSATLNANFEKQLKVWETWKEFPGVPEWM